MQQQTLTATGGLGSRARPRLGPARRSGGTSALGADTPAGEGTRPPNCSLAESSPCGGAGPGSYWAEGTGDRSPGPATAGARERPARGRAATAPRPGRAESWARSPGLTHSLAFGLKL